jgi:hypothetical protein
VLSFVICNVYLNCKDESGQFDLPYLMTARGEARGATSRPSGEPSVAVTIRRSAWIVVLANASADRWI